MVRHLHGTEQQAVLVALMICGEVVVVEHAYLEDGTECADAEIGHSQNRDHLREMVRI